MPADETDTGDAETSPEEVFALIGNETRAEILRVLGESPYEGLSFSELRSRVDEDIDSGQFNYHLQQLVGQFVEQTDEGYKLRTAGVTLYRTIRAGTFNRHVDIEPFDAGFDCYFCDAPVGARYEDGDFVVQCPDCDHVYTHTRAPPSAVDDEDERAVLSRIDQYNRHKILAFAQGVCPICVNPVERKFVPGGEVWAEGSEDLDVFVQHTCPHCGNQQFTSVGLALVYHPQLVSFCYERGLDVTSVPHWELDFTMSDEHLTVRSTDPWEVVLRVSRDGDALELVVDEQLNVLEANVVTN